MNSRKHTSSMVHSFTAVFTTRLSLAVLLAALLMTIGACKKAKERAPEETNAAPATEDDEKEKKAEAPTGPAAGGDSGTKGKGAPPLSRKLIIDHTMRAKRFVDAISRHAAAAYEREQLVDESKEDGDLHHICGSAIPVPTFVPKGVPYQPSSEDGKDFHTGDKQTGWKCLKFDLSKPQYAQFHYSKDGSTVAPKNRDACVSNCYEVGAVMDLDGDGVKAKYVRTGKIDPKTGFLKSSTRYFIENEYE